MEIIKDPTGAIVFKGQMIVSEIEAIHNTLEPLFDESLSEIVLDLSQVTEMDTSGLQLLYSIRKAVENDGSFRIKAVSPSVKMAFVLSGFDLVLKEVAG